MAEAEYREQVRSVSNSCMQRIERAAGGEKPCYWPRLREPPRLPHHREARTPSRPSHALTHSRAYRVPPLQCALERQELLSNPDVVTKYKAAAKIVNEAIVAIVDAAKAGTLITDLCDLGDKFISEEAGKLFKKAKDEKKSALARGVAVPTCISVNNCVGHWTPVDPETVVQTLKEGDMVKVDLGCHIDGYVSQAAHTFVVGATKVSGRDADVMQCAKDCYEAAARLIRPGNRVNDVPPMLAEIARHYACSHVSGVMSNSMNRFVIDQGKMILNRNPTNPEERMENAVFEEGEVYSIDLIVSTGDGLPRLVDEKETTVFKRNWGTYHLSMKSSRQLLSQIDNRFSMMLFSLRNLEGGAAAANDTKVKMAIRELTKGQMIAPFPVTWEKEGEKVAQVKGTFITMPNGNDRLNGFPGQAVESDKKASLPEDVKALLSTSLKPKKKKKKSSS